MVSNSVLPSYSWTFSRLASLLKEEITIIKILTLYLYTLYLQHVLQMNAV